MAGKKENNSKNGSAASRGSRKNSSSGAKKSTDSTASGSKSSAASGSASSGKKPKKNPAGSRMRDEIVAIFMVALGIFLLASLMTEATGEFGEIFSMVLKGLFGLVAYILPFFLIIYARFAVNYNYLQSFNISWSDILPPKSFCDRLNAASMTSPVRKPNSSVFCPKSSPVKRRAPALSVSFVCLPPESG